MTDVAQSPEPLIEQARRATQRPVAICSSSTAIISGAW